MRRRWLNISRPCYDKYRRCPGWAGGGLKFAKKKTCESGSLVRMWDFHGDLYEYHLWKWCPYKCDTCGVVALPYVIRYVDPSYWWSEVKHNVWEFNWFLKDIRKNGWKKAVMWQISEFMSKYRWTRRIQRKVLDWYNEKYVPWQNWRVERSIEKYYEKIEREQQ